MKQHLITLKSELLELKDSMEQSGFSRINNYQEADAIDRITRLINEDKIEINGKERFEIKKKSERMGKVSEKIRWQSLNSIGKGCKAIAGEQPSIAKRMLQEVFVTTIAQKQGLLFDEEDKKDWGEVLSQGTEAFVYYNSESVERAVVKTLDYSRNRGHDLSEFAERMIGFNTMFPQTKHNLIGFVKEKNMAGDRIMLKPVLQQAFVEGKTLLKFSNSQREFEKAMKFFQEVDYTVKNGNMLCKKGWIADDLNLGNIIKTPDGKYFVIDAFVKRENE